MYLKLKYKIGERPWMMWENKAVQCVVQSIRIDVYRKVTDVTYKIIVEGSHQDMKESMLFKSKRMLLRSL